MVTPNALNIGIAVLEDYHRQAAMPHRGVDTQRLAVGKHAERIAGVNRTVLRLFQTQAELRGIARGLTNDEIAQLLPNIPTRTLQPRTAVLVKLGYLTDGGVRRENRRGNAEKVYVLTREGAEHDCQRQHP